ncbi:MAG: hypothetical protein K6B52_06155 [Clostridiales bacterium]|nr:hypothetical protein [Clostridiales bacterium]
MFIKNYLFASFGITALSEKRIADSPGFSPFLSDKIQKTAINVQFEILPQICGEVIRKELRKELVAVNGLKRLFTFFQSGSGVSDTPCACFEWGAGKNTLYVSGAVNFDDNFFFDAVDALSLLTLSGAGLLHCSFVNYSGHAVLFAGDKQAGKSTSASLWETYAVAKTVNGDRAAIRIENGIPVAYSTPYCGSSDITFNFSLPLAAIALPQKSAFDLAVKISKTEAFLALFNLFTFNAEDETQTGIITDILAGICESVPVFSLNCTKSEGQVVALKRAIDEFYGL